MQCGARQSDAQARVDYNRTIGRMLDEEGWRAAKDGRASATGQNEADSDADLPEPSPMPQWRMLQTDRYRKF